VTPSPIERPGRDPEREADRLRARFAAVSRSTERQARRPMRFSWVALWGVAALLGFLTVFAFDHIGI